MNASRRWDATKSPYCFAVIIIIYGLLLAAYSLWRPIDGDEGYYASAASLIAGGNIVYSDFFYPQAPILPYAYALVYRLAPSLSSLRFLSVIFSIFSIGLWWIYLKTEYQNTPKVALASLLILLINPYLTSWNVTVKTYALSNCLITAALVVLYTALKTKRSIWYAMCGVLLGILVSVRLLYAPIGVLIFL